MKEKNKLNEMEESKKQKSAKSSFNNSPPLKTPSYDERKPSILDDKDNNNTGTVCTPQLMKKSVVSSGNTNYDRRSEGDECFCDNSCTGNFFSYHKKPKKQQQNH